MEYVWILVLAGTTDIISVFEELDFCYNGAVAVHQLTKQNYDCIQIRRYLEKKEV